VQSILLYCPEMPLPGGLIKVSDDQASVQERLKEVLDLALGQAKVLGYILIAGKAALLL
jgi:hypothetical protein